MSAMDETATATRAPRLTATRLDDLDELVVSANADIAYLSEAVPNYEKGTATHEKLASRLARLTRARDWLTGKIAAERANRGDT